MQLAIDSTSLGEFKTCPTKYFYSIVLGLAPRETSPHLTFGLFIHAGREHYEHSRSAGFAHEESLDRTLQWLLEATWNKELGRPLILDHPTKNRRTLVQTLVWYLDALAQNDPLETVQLANGKPAVELSFRFDSGLRTRDGETILFCGHLDRLAKMNGVAYVPDIKTASSEPNANWARQFSPSNQFSLYDLAASVAFAYPIQGLMVDGIQVGVTFARFARHFVPRTIAQREEWLADATLYIEQMEQCALRESWPMNDKACTMYGGCPFQSICSKSPASRAAWLEKDFVLRKWDPLQIRGDI